MTSLTFPNEILKFSFKGFVGLRWVIVELFKKECGSNVSKCTVILAAKYPYHFSIIAFTSEGETSDDFLPYQAYCIDKFTIDRDE